ncbi:MAG TPA: response regulator [Chitinophagaceae bacterium]|nr:response regulator [Chitinophagaceae bacterium]
MTNDVRILLVEDNEGDVVLTLEALKEANMDKNVGVIRDGESALQYLKQENSELPDLIMLDINLPRIDGIEVLAQIKSNNTLKAIPVIMLTTSNAESDIVASYSNYANCYITKPVGLKNFMDVIMTIKEFWIKIVKLPKTVHS